MKLATEDIMFEDEPHQETTENLIDDFFDEQNSSVTEMNDDYYEYMDTLE
ncbi:MAG: hypothetical protein L3I99_01855 [Sulfurimonas sp.]|nr:hypothetical protein [Sulfurimonas sp.]